MTALPPPLPPGHAALRALVARLQARQAAPTPGAAAEQQANAVAAHQATWQRLRAEQRLRQALAQVPAQAGPLNSSQLVHRTLRALHAASPAYLDAFMRHADNLLWLEQAAGLAEPERAPGKAARPSRGRAR